MHLSWLGLLAGALLLRFLWTDYHLKTTLGWIGVVWERLSPHYRWRVAERVTFALRGVRLARKDDDAAGADRTGDAEGAAVLQSRLRYSIAASTAETLSVRAALRKAWHDRLGHMRPPPGGMKALLRVLDVDGEAEDALRECIHATRLMGATEERFWLEFVRRVAERELHLQERIANLRTVPPDAP